MRKKQRQGKKTNRLRKKQRQGKTNRNKEKDPNTAIDR